MINSLMNKKKRGLTGRDAWAPNNLLTPEQKKTNHQLNPGGPSNRQEVPAPTNLNE